MSAEPKFKIGDTVKLKSGGPDMTVFKTSKDYNQEFTGKYTCQWFAGKKLESGVFEEDALNPVGS